MRDKGEKEMDIEEWRVESGQEPPRETQEIQPILNIFTSFFILSIYAKTKPSNNVISLLISNLLRAHISGNQELEKLFFFCETDCVVITTEQKKKTF